MELFAIVLGFFGFVALMVPVFHVNKYARLLHQLTKVEPVIKGTEQARHIIEKKLNNHKDSWRPWKGWCLIGGTLMVIGSYSVQLINVFL